MPVIRNPQFYFREGFCWTDVNSTFLKARLKAKGIFDVLSMSLFTTTSLPDLYYVALINSRFISYYVDRFINNTSHFQINDARQLPIVIPTEKQLVRLLSICENAISIKQSEHSPANQAELLAKVQGTLDSFVFELYSIE